MYAHSVVRESVTDVRSDVTWCLIQRTLGRLRLLADLPGGGGNVQISQVYGSGVNAH